MTPAANTALPAGISDQLIDVWRVVRDVQVDLYELGEELYGYGDNDERRISQAEYEKIDEFWGKLRQAADTLAEITADAPFWAEDAEDAA